MINLLPPPYKEELKREDTFRLSIILGNLILLFLICLALLLFSIRIYLMSQIQVQDIQLSFQKQQLAKQEPVRAEIQEANRVIRNISTFYTNQTKVSGILERLTPYIPEGVYLTSFNFTPQPVSQDSSKKPNIKISLTGFAITRDILFTFKENFERDPTFLNLYSPPTNWVKPVEVNFALSFEIAP